MKMEMNKIVKITLNTLVYLIGVLSIVVITLSVLATLLGYGHLNIFELWSML